MKKILLAVDGSKHARNAACFLLRLPHEESFEVIVVSVVQRPMISQSYVSWEELEVLYQSQRKQADENFSDVAAFFNSNDCKIEHQCLDGSAGPTIVEFADQSGCDLIVVGAKGHSQVHRMLLGSVSDYVATHAKCSVLIVRGHLDQTVSDGHPVQMLIGCDGSDPSLAAIDEIAKIPWGKTVRPHLLSVAPFLFDFFGELTPDTQILERYRAILDSAKQQLADVDHPVKLHPPKAHLIEREHVGEGMVEFAEELQCDILVIGETPRITISRLLLGSVSRYVLRHAPCSVWIARNWTHQEIKSPG
jgi:nucleotide-binding universal stress UspA family protein